MCIDPSQAKLTAKAYRSHQKTKLYCSISEGHKGAENHKKQQKLRFE